MTAIDEDATTTVDEAPVAYLPRSASAHVSAAQPTGLAPLLSPAARAKPERKQRRR